MKIRVVYNQLNQVMCEIRIPDDDWINNEVPFISAPDCCHFEFLSKENIPFDEQTGVVQSRMTKI